MSKISPTGREAPFHTREMFYSETDPKGVIRSSNEIFERVSGYLDGELIGKPHRIIRHPDMPRSLFQLFWRTLKSGQPIAAFVKNLAANGDHYWVLAAAFPSPDGFVSIRIKATTSYLPTVAQIYADMRLIEQQGDLDAAEAFLLDQVKALGFDDYRIFTVAALNAELSTRKQAVVEFQRNLPEEPSNFKSIQSIRALSEGMSLAYESVTERIAPLLDTQQKIFRAAFAIATDFRTIKHTAINMIMNAERLGEESRTISVIAKTFKTCSESILQAVEKLQEAVVSMKEATASASFIIASARMQVEMLAFFSQEISDKMQRDPSFDPTTELTLFTGLCRDALLNANKQMNIMKKEVNEAKPWLAQLAEAVATLFFVRQNAMMEIAMIPQGDEIFNAQIKEMNVFMTSAKREGNLISMLILELNHEISFLLKSIDKIERNLTL